MMSSGGDVTTVVLFLRRPMEIRIMQLLELEKLLEGLSHAL